jgi:hypothetical protein
VSEAAVEVDLLEETLVSTKSNIWKYTAEMEAYCIISGLSFLPPSVMYLWKS